MQGIKFGSRLIITATSAASFFAVYLGNFYISPSYVQLELGQPANAQARIVGKLCWKAAQSLGRFLFRRGRQVSGEVVGSAIQEAFIGNSTNTSPRLHYAGSIFVDAYGNRFFQCNRGNWYIYNHNIGGVQQIYTPSGNVYRAVDFYQDSSGNLYRQFPR